MTYYPSVPTAAEEAWHDKFVAENGLDDDVWDGFEEWMADRAWDAALERDERADDMLDDRDYEPDWG